MNLLLFLFIHPLPSTTHKVTLSVYALTGQNTFVKIFLDSCHGQSVTIEVLDELVTTRFSILNAGPGDDRGGDEAKG